MMDHNHHNQTPDRMENCLTNGCAYWPQCRGCGFDREEAALRLWALKRFGLRRTKNGLCGLTIRRAKK